MYDDQVDSMLDYEQELARVVCCIAPLLHQALTCLSGTKVFKTDGTMTKVSMRTRDRVWDEARKSHSSIHNLQIKGGHSTVWLYVTITMPDQNGEGWVYRKADCHLGDVGPSGYFTYDKEQLHRLLGEYQAVQLVTPELIQQRRDRRRELEHAIESVDNSVPRPVREFLHDH